MGSIKLYMTFAVTLNVTVTKLTITFVTNMSELLARLPSVVCHSYCISKNIEKKLTKDAAS